MIRASMNFCEQDNLHSSFIVEYYNTISSLPYIFLGYYGFYYYKQLHYKNNYSFILLILIGFGSCLFHATMNRFTQLLDEIPMIWLNTFLIYQICDSYLFFILSFMITIIYSIYHSYTIFLIYFGYTGLLIFLIPIFLNKNLLAKRLLILSLTLFIFGFIQWIIDNTFCSYVHNYYLHAWWHILSGFSVYFYIQHQLAMKPHNIYKYFPLIVIKVIQ